MKWKYTDEETDILLYFEKEAFNNLGNYSEILGKTCDVAFHRMFKLFM